MRFLTFMYGESICGKKINVTHLSQVVLHIYKYQSYFFIYIYNTAIVIHRKLLLNTLNITDMQLKFTWDNKVKFYQRLITN